MFKDLKWLRLTPDRPGRGGTKTGIHSFQQQPINDVRSLVGGHVYQGAWRREFSTAAYPAIQALPAGAAQPLALHVYVFPSETDPSAVPNATALSHQLEAASNRTYIRDVVGGGIRMGPRSQTAPPAIFQNINGRCFAVEGTGEGMIFDDRTPAIHAQPNQAIGIGTPKQPMPNTGGNLTASGTGYVFGDGATGSIYVNHPNPNNQLGTILAADTSVTISVIDTYPAIYSGALMTSTVANVDAVSSNIVPFVAPGSGISITTGTSLVTLVGGVWPAGWQYAGLSINFNGYSFVILSHGVVGAGNGKDLDGNALALTNVQLLIMGIYDGPTLVNVPYTITGCQVTMKDTGGGNNVNTLVTVNTNPAAVPPGVALGYSQSTASNLVQVKVDVVRTNGLRRNLGNISFGPEGALALHVIHNGIMPKDSFILQSVSAPFLETDVGSTIIVDGADVGGVGTLLVTTITDFKTTSQVWLASQNGVGTAIAGRLVVWGPKLQGIADATMGAGSTTLTSVSNPWTLGNIGDTIIIAAAGIGGNALLTSITGFTNAGQVTVGTASTGAVAGVLAYWQDILAGTTIGPTYAYAWYDPETGACSNISPMYQIAAPTAIGTYSDFSNLTPVFQIDQGSIAYPDQATDGIRFSHILFFRTLSTPGSSTLYPLGSLNPFVGKVHPGSGSTRGYWNPSTFHGWMGLPNNYTAAPPNVAAPNYWYDWSSDSDLLLSGGFRAPQETNSKPMVLLRGGATQPGYPFAQAYWDRRTWMICTQDPHTLIFSCDEAQCPLGLPEESFPPTNSLQIPATDGAGIALKTVGDTLILTTQHWAYMVVGNNESNYRLMKVSAGMAGVGYYQMDEFPTYTGAEGEPSTLFYLGRDRKVYQWTFGAQVIPISQAIQDQLDSALMGHGPFTPLLEYQFSRLHCVSAWGRRLVIVAPNPIEYLDLGPNQVHVYDIDNQVWSEAFHANGNGNVQDGLAPMTTVYGLDYPSNELFSVYDFDTNKVIVRSWIRDDLTTATNVYFTITTFPMNFDGKKTRKQIVSMNLHATAGSWTGGMFVDEATAAIAATFGAYPDPLYSIYAPVATPVDPGAQDIVVMGAQFTNQAPVVGHRFSFVVQKNADSNPAKVFALDVAYIDYTDPGEGEP